MRSSSPLFILFVLCISCTSRQNEGKVVAEIEAHGFPGGDFRIVRWMGLHENVVLESRLDSTGNGSCRIDLNRPAILYVKLGDRYREVYIEPGKKVLIDCHSNDKKIVFDGDLRDINTYLGIEWDLFEGNVVVKGKYIGLLESEQFHKRVDSLKVSLSRIHEGVMDSLRINADLRKKLTSKFNTRFVTLKLGYLFGQNSLALARGEKSYRAPAFLEGIAKEVPMDTAMMNLGVQDYLYLLSLYIQNEYYIPYRFEGQTIDSLGLGLKIDSCISKLQVPISMIEYLRALNVNIWFSNVGLTKTTDRLFMNYMKDFGSSYNAKRLQLVYDEWMSLEPGNQAPQFQGRTAEDEQMSLGSFRGKTVYVDVWATWCSPCIEEIPYAIKLEKKYSTRTDIAFVNLSIDRDADAWKQFLTSHNNWKGTHLLVEGEDVQELMKSYKLAGVPTYFIINKSGLIVSAKAERPSNARIAAKLDSVLSLSN